MSAWLTIVGMGEDGMRGLSGPASDAIAAADAFVGSERLLAMLPDDDRPRAAWPSPFDARAAIEPLRGRRVVVLATGDPMHYGAARAVLAAFPGEPPRVLPHISAFSLAAARLGWPLQEVETVSLHGRSTALLEPFIAPGSRILALTEGDATVRDVSARLVRRSYGGSILYALERMSGDLERCTSFPAQQTPETPFSDLLTLAIECRAEAGAPLLPRTPGLPDEAFLHDGLITKQDVRAITLSALAPLRGALLWDVGAGCGSIAIEWMRAARDARAVAFERQESRIGHIRHNADRLGAPGIRVVPGDLPSTLAGEEPPDAVFIGGGLGVPGVFEVCWEALRPGGRMVSNVVTLEGEAHLMDLQEKHGGDLLRIELAYLAPVGGFRAMRHRLPVMQWRAVKP